MVPTQLIHNFRMIVYQMRNIERPKNSNIFLNVLYEQKNSLQSK